MSDNNSQSAIESQEPIGTPGGSKGAAKKTKLAKKKDKGPILVQKEIELGKETFERVVASYMQTRVEIKELQEKLEAKIAQKKVMEESFEYLKKIDKKILEVGRNVAGIGEGVQEREDEKPGRKRKRTSLQKEARKVRKLIKLEEQHGETSD